MNNDAAFDVVMREVCALTAPNAMVAIGAIADRALRVIEHLAVDDDIGLCAMLRSVTDAIWERVRFGEAVRDNVSRVDHEFSALIGEHCDELDPVASLCMEDISAALVFVMKNASQLYREEACLRHQALTELIAECVDNGVIVGDARRGVIVQEETELVLRICRAAAVGTADNELQVEKIRQYALQRVGIFRVC